MTRRVPTACGSVRDKTASLCKHVSAENVSADCRRQEAGRHQNAKCRIVTADKRLHCLTRNGHAHISHQHERRLSESVLRRARDQPVWTQLTRVETMSTPITPSSSRSGDETIFWTYGTGQALSMFAAAGSGEDTHTGKIYVRQGVTLHLFGRARLPSWAQPHNGK